MVEPKYNKNRYDHGSWDVEGEKKAEEKKTKEKRGMQRAFGKTLGDVG